MLTMMYVTKHISPSANEQFHSVFSFYLVHKFYISVGQYLLHHDYLFLHNLEKKPDIKHLFRCNFSQFMLPPARSQSLTYNEGYKYYLVTCNLG